MAGHVVKLALGAILLVVPASQLRAECVGFPLKHYLKSADLVFSGRIQGLEQRDSIRTIVTFDVDRVWKGEVGRRLVLHQAVENIDSFRFVQGAIGAKYLVFATRLDARQRQEFELPERADAFGIPTCGGGTRKIDANIRSCVSWAAAETRIVSIRRSSSIDDVLTTACEGQQRESLRQASLGLGAQGVSFE